MSLSASRSWNIILCLSFQAEDGIRYRLVTGVQTCALPILARVFQQDPPGGRHCPTPARLGASSGSADVPSLRWRVCATVAVRWPGLRAPGRVKGRGGRYALLSGGHTPSQGKEPVGAGWNPLGSFYTISY